MATRKLISNNSKEVLKLLFKRLNYKYSNELFKELEEHPDFPSFLAFHHALKKWGIDSVALNVKFDELIDLPKPVLVHISSNDGMFLLIEKIDKEFVYVINEKGELEKQAINDFLQIWNGLVMVFDIENIKRKEYSILDKVALFLDKIKKPFLFLAALFLFVYSFTNNLSERNIYHYLFLIEFSAGMVFSILLLVEHFDKENQFVKNICLSENNKKINCGSILNSKDAYFLGLVSWSDVGFLYYLVLFIILLFFPVNLAVSFSIFTSVFIIPYVFYSLYYQKFIAKSWCVLCLFVQAVIVSIFVTSFFAFKNNFFNMNIILDNIMLLLVLISSVIAAYIIIKPLIYNHIKLTSVLPKYKMLKHNNLVVNNLFLGQNSYPKNGIEKLYAGNEESEQTLTIIFSPVCEPCVKELTELIPILRSKEETLIEFIFLVSKKETPLGFQITKVLLNSYNKNKDQFINDLEQYVNKYPKSKYIFNKKITDEKEDEKLEKVILEQEKWCLKNKIISTPVILLNHKEIPDIYTVKDIDYILI